MNIDKQTSYEIAVHKIWIGTGTILELLIDKKIITRAEFETMFADRYEKEGGVRRSLAEVEDIEKNGYPEASA